MDRERSYSFILVSLLRIITFHLLAKDASSFFSCNEFGFPHYYNSVCYSSILLGGDGVVDSLDLGEFNLVCAS